MQKVIVLDPGHGGSEPGSVALDGQREKQFTLELAKAVRTELLAGWEVAVTLTRETDQAVAPGQGLGAELRARAQVANNLHADLLVSLHHDSASDGKVRGGSIWVWTNKTAPDGSLAWLPATGNESAPRSHMAAKVIVKHVWPALERLGVPWRGFGDPDGVACADFGVLDATDGRAVLIECFHGTAQADLTAARRPEFIPTLAKAIAAGIAEAVEAVEAQHQPVPIPPDPKAIAIKDDAGHLLAQGWIEGDQTVVGLRPLCEAIGYKVAWNQTERSVTLTPKR